MNKNLFQILFKKFSLISNPFAIFQNMMSLDNDEYSCCFGFSVAHFRKIPNASKNSVVECQGCERRQITNVPKQRIQTKMQEAM